AGSGPSATRPPSLQREPPPGRGFAGRDTEPGSGAFGGGCRLGVVNEVLEFLAGLEEGNALGRHFDLFAGLRIASHAAGALAGAEAAEAANLDLLALLDGFDDAVENGLDDDLRFLAREFGDPQDLFDKVGLRQSGLLGHRCHASYQSEHLRAAV